MVLQSFDQGSALFILVEAPPFDNSRPRILFQNTLLQDWRRPRVLSSLLAAQHQTQPGGLARRNSKQLLLGGDFFAGTWSYFIMLQLYLDAILGKLV